MTSDLFHYIDWLQTHEWVFWILVNLSAYITYQICRYSIVGIFGIVLPMASATCTIMLASEWWMGSIGIVTIVIVSAPFFVMVWKDSHKSARQHQQHQ